MLSDRSMHKQQQKYFHCQVVHSDGKMADEARASVDSTAHT